MNRDYQIGDFLEHYSGYKAQIEEFLSRGHYNCPLPRYKLRWLSPFFGNTTFTARELDIYFKDANYMKSKLYRVLNES